jgi:hypothetical protein
MEGLETGVMKSGPVLWNWWNLKCGQSAQKITGSLSHSKHSPRNWKYHSHYSLAYIKLFHCSCEEWSLQNFSFHAIIIPQDYRNFQMYWSKRSESLRTAILLLEWTISRIFITLRNHFETAQKLLKAVFPVIELQVEYRVVEILVGSLLHLRVHYVPLCALFACLGQMRLPHHLADTILHSIYAHRCSSIVPYLHIRYMGKGLPSSLSLRVSGLIYLWNSTTKDRVNWEGSQL